MTNNPAIDGVSRERIAFIRSEVECGAPIDANSARDLLKVIDHQNEVALKISTAVERQEPVPSQVPVLRAMAANYRNGHQWDFLDGEAVNKAADEITRLQSTIAQLQAQIDILSSGLRQVVIRCNDGWTCQAVELTAQEALDACLDATAALNEVNE